MIKNLNIFLFITIILFFNQISAKEIKILYKIDQTIITSYDVDKEIDYLISLNKNFSNFDKKKIRKIAEESLIREKIKKNEIDKVYEIDYEIASQSEMISNFLKNFRINLGFNDESEFISYLKNKNINYNEIKVKFVIEQYWNQLIFDMFNRMVKVDKKKIKKIVDDLENNNSELTTFNLSEIVFSGKSKIEIDEKYDEILESIQNIGFKQTALLHSLSESAKFGGEIGWINQNQLSKKIYNKIKNLEIGEFSKPISSAGGSILIFINEKKKIMQKINKDEEIKKMISSEKNRQLNEFSIIHYKKLENKSYVEKL